MAKVKIFNESGMELPDYSSEGAGAVDLRATCSGSIRPKEVTVIPTGLFMEIPIGCVGKIYVRSGMSFKRGVMLVNGTGIIDSDFRGEVQVLLTSCTEMPLNFKKGERIGQMILEKVEKFEWEEVQDISELRKTLRGSGGFGSTGM